MTLMKEGSRRYKEAIGAEGNARDVSVVNNTAEVHTHAYSTSRGDLPITSAKHVTVPSPSPSLQGPQCTAYQVRTPLALCQLVRSYY